ncbi:MAG: hypothetical protein IT361_04740 [Gemmatimonadaceae bacterium]|nr:hypothetical protein [Gemmatimonadaceae bacterium]
MRGVQVPAGGLSNPIADTTYYFRDGDGALREDLRARQFQTVPLGPFYREARRTINTYDSERRLVQASFTLDTNPAPGPVTRYNRRETYRYDALGRRVWREMIRDTLNNVCVTHDRSSGCRSEVTRTVWDGASVLYEVRAPADTEVAPVF